MFALILPLLCVHCEPAERPSSAEFKEQPLKAWSALASDVPQHALVAVCWLVENPSIALPLLRKHLKPVPRPDPQILVRLVANLDSDDFATRERSTKKLARHGTLAKPSLQAGLKQKLSLDARRRIEDLLRDLEGPVTDSDLLRQIRSTEVLERIGSPEAIQFLGELGQGAPEARLTREAKQSLARLAKRAHGHR